MQSPVSRFALTLGFERAATGFLVSLTGSLVLFLGPPSITREIRSEFSFLHENNTFLDFLIDV